ncbi:GNAT family N-acetyltransferase [Sporosarcina aquimarina]|uniref:GNAT family N-acetyltransferase n=1 Tax=Sporosarcina aquimarina TaxID=114975 RepID=UPI00204186CB|nr:GNAT family N-acetyltransferase [Sporosarcina aquimarina]MCM3758827.1 GNAT family N-acetyltransferase [Sporosarcina aquimarina]
MIRQMIEEDIAAVQHIARATWKDTYKELLPEFVQQKFLDSAYSTPMLLKRMEKTEVLIAERDGRAVGFFNMTQIDVDGDAELTALYVLPDYQRQGIGMELFAGALTLLSDAMKLFVYVDDLNDPAKAFYEKLGFELLEVFDEDFEGVPVETAQYVYMIRQSALCI